MASKIVHYPVGNGDQGLISIDEGGVVTNILIDCNICECNTENKKFDVKKSLLSNLKTRTVNGINSVSYADVFILTHGDNDHLRGFEEHFYQGDPKNFNQKNIDEIFIDVLWFTPMIMGSATNEDEKCFNKEAKRRIELHRSNNADRDLPGNRIVIIGNDASEDLKGLNLVRKVPGEVVKRFNDKELSTFSIFIHSPYQEQLTDEEVDKNRTSLVFQARFKAYTNSSEFCTLAMFGGDSNHEAWATILEKTKRYKNDVKEQALKWDLFLAPHHCSWTFFNNTPQIDNPVPVKTSTEVLDNRRHNGKVIASCKEIENNEDNPPHYKAKLQYISKVGETNFICLQTFNTINGIPQPVIFEISSQGPVIQKKKEGSTMVAGGAGLSSLNKPSSYGAENV